MRILSVLFLVILAGCARPLSQSATPMPMAAGCPMMHGGGTHAMAGMATTASADSGVAHPCPCPMHDQMHAMAHDSGATAHENTGNTHVMAGCPMCTSGHCPMHAATPPESGVHTH